MSQWGTSKTICGQTFMPYVETRPFVPVSPVDRIRRVICTHSNGTDPALIAEMLAYEGKLYGDWLRMAG